MPYLSLTRINPMRATGRAMLANPHRVHAMIQQGIATQPVRERTLWRWEHTGNPHQRHLLVLTASRPDWNHLTEQAGWPHADGEHFTIRDYRPVFAHLTPGRTFGFKLTANPVHNTHHPATPSPQQAARRARDPACRGARLGRRTSADHLDWLVRHSARHGFTLPAHPPSPDPTAPGAAPPTPYDLRLTAHGRLRFTKNAAPTPPITLVIATFEGSLTVTDPTLLRAALLHGIGPAKSYGCGLLTLTSPQR